jgi:tRNA modification GTPase
MLEEDTICAVSTPPGEGGIGIIRISGKDALVIAKKVFKQRSDKDISKTATHSIHYGHVIDPTSGETVDEVLVSVMQGPTTYTREDIIEINCHGGMMPLRRTIELLINAGARMAEPGEFTKRAFLNGRIDLTQAEAVMDIIRAKTDLCHRAANEQLFGGLATEISRIRDHLVSVTASVEAGIDFPEEDIETDSSTQFADEISDIITSIEELLVSYNYGKILRDGFATAIIGRPNVGKSSLLNALLRQNRAIVTEMPGTTRDVLEEYLNISGIPIKILDTAGIRRTHDPVEQEGVRRSLAAIESADIVIVVLDGSEMLTDEDERVLEKVKGKNVIVTINKSDLPRKLYGLAATYMQMLLSCRTGDGLNDLKRAISDMVKQGTIGSREHAWTVNQRHKTALSQAKESLNKSLNSIISDLSPEFVAVDLRSAIDSLGLIIGATYTEDILERIFSDFCIGK